MSNIPPSVSEPREIENKTGVEYDETKSKILFAEDINSLWSAIVAIQNYLIALRPGNKYYNDDDTSIGHNAPIYDLDVKGTIACTESGGELGNGTSGSNSGIAIWSVSGIGQILAYVSSIFRIGTRYAKDMTFLTNNIERMRVTSAGNVGINYTSPNSYLTIYNDSKWFESSLNIDSNTNCNTVLQVNRALGHRFAGISYGLLRATEWWTGTTYNGGVSEYGFSIGTTSTRSDTKLYITTSGNVGIGTGTTDPTEKLEVNGTIKATGYKSSDGSTGQTVSQTVVTNVRMNSGTLQKKTQTLTFKNGLLTARSAETDWVNA